MWIDRNLELCDAVDMSDNTGTSYYGDSIDLDAAGRNIGRGMPLALVIQVTVGATPTNSDYTFKLTTGTAVASGNISSGADDVWQSVVFDAAELPKGAVIIAPLMGGSVMGSKMKRYLQLRLTIATANSTALTVNAFLTDSPEDWEALAAAPARLV